jgi:HSP20 family protein
MSKLDVFRTGPQDDRSLPIFDELDELTDRIRVRAYNLFKSRGGDGGNDVDDWLTAERLEMWPAAELREKDDVFKIRVALAGFDDDDIEVTAAPREIIVKAQHEEAESDDEDTKTYWSEFRSNTVYRRIELPSPIEVDDVTASLDDGVLKIKARKSVDKPRDVEITSAA